MNVIYDANSPICVECGRPFERAVRKQGGGVNKIYCTPKCRSNSWARGNTDKRKVSVIKYDSKPESKEIKKERSRRARFSKYNLTEEDVTLRLYNQKHLCLGCNKKLSIETARIDHCHVSGKVRGLLCDHCNWALGHAKDDPDILRKLAEYLDEQTISHRLIEESSHSSSREQTSKGVPRP